VLEHDVVRRWCFCAIVLSGHPGVGDEFLVEGFEIGIDRRFDLAAEPRQHRLPDNWPVSETREPLRRTFDTAADLYEAARPSYPDELFDDLVELAELEPGDKVLEIGCATGKATRSMLERGFSVVCVEVGRQLAERARRNLAGLPVEIDVAPFEEWQGEPGTFDLVYAATAWHWIDPEVRYRKVHRLLRPSGHLAFWSAFHAFPAGFDPFFTEIQKVYDAIGESHPGEWPPLPPEEVPDEAAEIEASALFTDAKVRRYIWETSYSAEEYVALLNTFSGHIAMDKAKRKHLYREIRRRMGQRPDGRVLRHWGAILHVARRRDEGRPTHLRRPGAADAR
jgi:SAM-dependent methyltransferase